MEEYNHKKIEKKWQKIWEKKKVFEAKDGDKKPKFYGLVEFPFLSGEGLHVGHIRSYTALDVISHKRRAEGFNVLYPIGYDAFGLPIENFAIKSGKQPALIVKKTADTFRQQLKSLGFGFDWSREINTSDPSYYKWTQWIFLQFLKRGLAYKKKMPINWCPKDKIGLANEEVVDGCCERCGTPVEKKDKEQWMLAITKYADRLDKDLDTVDFLEKIKIQQRNWIGKSEGAEIEFKVVAGEGRKLPQKILIGTRNQAKIKMVKVAFPDAFGIEFLSLDDIPSIDDSSLVEGDDFKENARKKAEFYFKKTGIPTISTDHILWVEKYSENGGYIVHIRKLANPNSSRATDKEVGKWVEDFVDKHGESKAAFHYAVSFTDSNGTLDFVVKQKEYILQKTQASKKNEGYVFDQYLKDPKTGELRVDQKFMEGFGFFAELINNEFLKKFSQDYRMKVFTTRPDTLFGCTYLVLAPEHPLLKNNELGITNNEEITRYIALSKKKTEMERTEEGKEKTGVELKGIKAINPANGEEVPVWIADYVLADYGTGAVMAVPAHDERDFEFAKKYNLSIKTVIRTNSKTQIKFLVKSLVPDWLKKIGGWQYSLSTDFLELILPDNETDSFISVGQEILNDGPYYFSVRDNTKRIIYKSKVFDIYQKNGDKEAKDFGQRLSVPTNELNWRTSVTKNGRLVNSEKFDGLNSEEAKWKITEAVGGKKITKFKLRDWVFSRQHYWGEPIPVVFCTNCFAQDNNLNAIIIHGCPSSVENAKNPKKRTYDKHWIPWIKKHLEKLSIKTINPFMPEPWDASYENWKKEFEKFNITENTILIGHSCGTAFLVRWLGETKRKVFGLILVAPWKISYGEGEVRKRKEAFYNYEIDSEIKNRIKNIAIFTSDNEEADGKKSTEIFEKGLNPKVINLKNHGHYTYEDMGGEEFPEVIELISNWASSVVPVPEKDLPIELPKVEKYQPTDTGESPLAGITKWVNTKCPRCSSPAKRETDTMPNWAGSSWYYLRYIDPKNKKAFVDQKKLAYWSDISSKLITTNYELPTNLAGPVNWYNGGMEHTTLHLLYSRFWHKFLFDLGLVPTFEPYKKRTSHGLILAEGGVKMSKSRPETIINPDDLIERFGADSLRLYEMFMGPFDQAVAWSVDGIVGTRRFLEKVWRIGERLKLQVERFKKEKSELTTDNLKLTTLIHKTIKKVDEDIEKMRFNTAVSALMILANEMSSLEVLPKECFEIFLKLLSPFAPHIAEELWSQIGNSDLVALRSWPAYLPSKIIDDEVTIAVQINGKVRGEFSAPQDILEPEAIEKAKSLPIVKKWLERKEIKKAIFIKGRLVSLVV